MSSTTISENYALAIERVKSLSRKPTNEELLRLYGMFKYVKSGNTIGSAPSLLWNATGYYKWHEWRKYDNQEKDAVREQYIAYVDTLVDKYADGKHTTA